MEIYFHAQLPSCQIFILNDFHKLHVEKSVFSETSSCLYISPHYCSVLRSQSILQVLTRALWCGLTVHLTLQASKPRLELGLLRWGSEEYRCLSLIQLRKLHLNIWSDLCIFIDHTHKLHIAQRSWAKHGLGRHGSG